MLVRPTHALLALARLAMKEGASNRHAMITSPEVFLKMWKTRMHQHGHACGRPRYLARMAIGFKTMHTNPRSSSPS